MKLHIGCGKKYLTGYKHIDIMEYPHIDFVTMADNLYMIEDNCVDEIYACHVLEHFKRTEYRHVLKEWHRVLKKHGIIRIAVPDFDAVVEHYLLHKDLRVLLGLLYGGQNYEYNYHYVTFSFAALSETLTEVGFGDVKTYDWRDFLPDGFDDYSRCYLPHMDFDNGKLMSLNVITEKL